MTVPDLQQIAAANIAVCLWNHIDDFSKSVWRGREHRYLDNPPSVIFESTESIPLPKSLTSFIKEYVKKVCDEIKKWAYYHNHKIFFIEYHNAYYGTRFLDYFVWRPDCTIDDVRTALNLQNSIGLNELQKFQFLCLYCLEEQIEQKWKLLCEKKVFHTPPFDDQPLLFYWNRYCRRRLEDVPVPEGLSVDEFMFRHRKVDNWPAKEYFFDRLNVDEQIQGAISIIDTDGVKYQESVIAKLNPSQRAVLFASNSMQIITNYIRTSTKSGFILPTWHAISEIVTKQDFVSILKEFFPRNIIKHIVAEIWISASDELKHHALNYKNDEFIETIWNSLVDFYNDDLFQMLLDASPGIRDEIKTMTVFIEQCEDLLCGDKIPTLKRTLNLCFRKSDELESVKRTLALGDVCKRRCRILVRGKNTSQLEKLLDFFSSDAIVLNELKDYIVNEQLFNDTCKNLVENGEISKLDELLNVLCQTKIEQTKQSIRDFFDVDYFIDRCERLILQDKIVELDQILTFFCFNVDESIQFKQSFIEKKFFSEHCEELITSNALSKLEELFKSFFPRDEELVEFKRSISKKKFFSDHYLTLITSDELSQLYNLEKIFLPKDEEPERFREDLTQKQGFLHYCEDFILNYELSKLTDLLNTLFSRCFEKMIKFKRELARKKCFDMQCRKLIELHQLPKLDELLNWGFPSFEEQAAFKKYFVGTKMFADIYQTMIDTDDFTNLESLLVWSFPVTEELIQFKHDLASSKRIKDRCLNLIATEASEKRLNDLLTFLFSSHNELVYEYKRNLLISEEGFEICYILINQPNTVLENTIIGCLPTSITLAEFKKQMIFSPAAISLLKKAAKKDGLADVKKFVDWFLESDNDKKLLKMQLLNDPSEFITMLFFDPCKSSCQSKINWWLPDEAAIREYKMKIPLDEVFEAGLKRCVFQTTDSYGRASRCVLKKNFDLESLDRFLSWYFETSKTAKEYKIQRFRAYESIETISLMLKKGCKRSNFNQLSNWFFDNDVVQMAKFKKRHKGEKIADMMNNSRDSYFRSRRSL